MEFLNVAYLALLLIPLILMVVSLRSRESFDRYFNSDILKLMMQNSEGMSKKNRLILLNISLAFAIIALARPIINRGEIKVKQEFIDIVVAFDISRSMFASDIYPNRLEFSKKKFFELLDELKEARVGVVAFSSRAFLVSPITNDFHTLKYLVKNLDTNFITLHGTDIMQPLEVAKQYDKG